MAGYVCPRVLSPSTSVQTAKEVIAAVAARGNSQADLRRLEIERMEELLQQRAPQAPERTSLGGTYDSQMAFSDVAAGQQSALDDAILFFDVFDPSNGVPDNGIIDLADALTIGDFDFLDQ